METASPCLVAFNWKNNKENSTLESMSIASFGTYEATLKVIFGEQWFPYEDRIGDLSMNDIQKGFKRNKRLGSIPAQNIPINCNPDTIPTTFSGSRIHDLGYHYLHCLLLGCTIRTVLQDLTLLIQVETEVTWVRDTWAAIDQDFEC